ncbi:unnamed protein product [Adineta ricciae]|uniref:Uncharacterized protein n=1 Tax=Adineta ricciae TaxID=249248 RepID=A0A814RK58_ADIRI|nr:unnamed protein product [Adineta ricciae]CAF1135006.1 unnamed protein product [Adineta ricciae]
MILVGSIFCVLFAAANSAVVYGPSAQYYPTRTPTIAEALLFGPSHKKVVPFDAKAIEDAANSFTDEQVNRGVVVFVLPGTVVGLGAGSRATPFIKNVGKTGRTRKILITPLNGWGSCMFNGSVKIQSCYGVAFGGFKFIGGDAYGNKAGFLAQDCTESSVFNLAPLSTFGGQTIENTPSWDIEYINIVTPNAFLKYDADNNADTAAFRTATKGPVSGVRFQGCYFAPSYRELGSVAHTDTFQFSGNAAYSDIQYENTVVFGSTNSALQVGAASNYRLLRTLVIGGKTACVRYPVPPGADGYAVGYVTPNALNGAATNASAIDSLMIGSIGATRWAFQSGSTIVYTPQASQQPAAGLKWNVDTSLSNVDKAWIDARVPYPTEAYLKTIFGNAGQSGNN